MNETSSSPSPKQVRTIVLVTIFFTALAIVLLRLLFAPPSVATHHHGNFGIFIDGERLDLSDDRYMEDVEGCKPDYLPLQPQERTHLHNNEDEVVHVHDEGVTWGHFLQNIGFAMNDISLTTDTGEVYQNQGRQTLTFVLNGEVVETVSNRLINSEDRLAISFGTESVDEVIENQYQQVADNAAYHNEHPDPGSCSGDIDAGLWTKLRKAVWY